MKQTMSWPILIVTMLIAGTSSAAMAECRSNDDVALAYCLALDMWTTDQKINQVYQELMTRYSDSEKKILRDEQRSWLRTRNSVCHLDARESNREKWIQAISSDYQKTVCVVRFTQHRIYTLESYQKNGIANAVRQETLPVLKEETSRPTSPGLPPDYTTRGDIPRSDGKWYFEIKVNQAELAKHGNASLYLGLEDHLGNGYGKLLYAYGSTTKRTVFNYGFAVDGEWLVAAPGSAKGMDLKLNRRYFVKVTSSAPVFNPLRSPVNVVSINTGEEAFDYSLPAGYRPFNGQ